MAVLGIFKVIKDLVFPTLDKAIVDKDLVRQLQNDIQMAILNADNKELESATTIIVAEAQGESWLQRNWRPLTMLSMVALIGAYYLGFAPPYLIDNPDLAEKLFTVVQVGLGGYVVGRSGEKMMETYQEPKRLEAEAKKLEAERKPVKIR